MEVIAGGTTGLIKLRLKSTLVENAPYPNSSDAYMSIRDLRREYIAYKKLPQHPRLLRLHSDSTPERLVLPYLHNGCLHALHDLDELAFIKPSKKEHLNVDQFSVVVLLT